MLKHKGPLFLCIVLSAVFLKPACWAQSSPQQEKTPIRVQADSLHRDEQQDTVTASGNVLLKKGDTTLQADTVTLHRATNEMEAHGHVVLKDPQAQIESEALQLDTEDETGTITNGTIHLPRRQFVLTGKTIHKSYGQSYHIENGAFTTCQCEKFKDSDWTIGGNPIDVNVRGRGEVYNGLLRARDIPILYIPYATMAVRNERQSGFLFPYYLYSTTRGLVVELPFYWAINRSYDATFTADYESISRIGAWGEFRYAPNQKTEGQFGASYFNEQLRDASPNNPPLSRWSITGTHRQELADDMRFASDLFFVSDTAFLREISHRALSLPSTQDDYYSEWSLPARRYTDSRFNLVKDWKNAFLRTEAAYYQDLVDDQNYAFQVLPRVQFKEQQFLWHNRLEANIAVEGDNFYRNKGYAGQRLDIAPSVAMPFHFGDYAFGSIGVTGRETAYHLTSQEPGPSTVPTPNLHSDRTRELVQFDANIRTRLSRVFDVNIWKLLKLQHIVEPEISYRYIPLINQEDLPLYDNLDRIGQRNVWIYGVTNRFLGQFRTTPAASSGAGESTETRDLGSITLTHAYDPSRQLNLEKNHYSDVDVLARFSPFPFANFSFKATYDINNGSAAETRVSASLYDPRPISPLPPMLQYLQRISSLTVAYGSTSARLIKAFDAGLPNPPTNVTTAKGITSVLTLRLNESIQASYVSRYDFNTSSFTADRYFLRYLAPQHCWFIELGAVDKVNPSEFQFHFMFTFLGLGSSGGRPSF